MDLARFLRILFATALVAFLAILAPGLYQRTLEDAANVLLLRAWFGLEFPGERSVGLRDGIPDEWQPSIWGGVGRAVHGRDPSQPHSGAWAAFIRPSNREGYAVYVQELQSTPVQLIRCGVYSRGGEGFSQVKQGESALASAAFPASATWTLTQWQFTPLDSPEPVMLYLGIGGATSPVWFDDAFCRPADTADNLIHNDGFEIDGSDEDVQLWWQRVISSQPTRPTLPDWVRTVILDTPSSYVSKTNRLNLWDLLAGELAAVRVRMQNVSAGCVGPDGNPTVLLGLERQILEQAGPAGYERALELAMSLMPACPQPYAGLARLYAGDIGNETAAGLYAEAVAHAQPGPQKGRYAFALGYLDMIWLGNLERARRALQGAIENPGWEGSPWHFGAAHIYLAHIYAAQGLCPEARAEYTAVLACIRCAMHHDEARAALTGQGDCRP